MICPTGIGFEEMNCDRKDFFQASENDFQASKSWPQPAQLGKLEN